MTQINECQNCGAELAQTDKRCPYCGTANPNYSVPTPIVSTYGPASSTSGSTVASQSSFSVGLFIVLLIFFWPAAIVYAIVKSVKK